MIKILRDKVPVIREGRKEKRKERENTEKNGVRGEAEGFRTYLVK